MTRRAPTGKWRESRDPVTTIEPLSSVSNSSLWAESLATRCPPHHAKCCGGPNQGGPCPGVPLAARRRSRSKQARDRPCPSCNRRADRGDSPTRGASSGEQGEQENDQRECCHDRPVVQAVRHRIRG